MLSRGRNQTDHVTLILKWWALVAKVTVKSYAVPEQPLKHAPEGLKNHFNRTTCDLQRFVAPNPHANSLEFCEVRVGRFFHWFIGSFNTF